jgi:hypothetical protein
MVRYMDPIVSGRLQRLSSDKQSNYELTQLCCFSLSVEIPVLNISTIGKFRYELAWGTNARSANHKLSAAALHVPLWDPGLRVVWTASLLPHVLSRAHARVVCLWSQAAGFPCWPQSNVSRWTTQSCTLYRLSCLPYSDIPH